jgi:hypothetical protein
MTVAQLSGANWRARSYRGNHRISALKFWPSIAQRAKVLVAERSAEMAQED